MTNEIKEMQNNMKAAIEAKDKKALFEVLDSMEFRIARIPNKNKRNLRFFKMEIKRWRDWANANL